MEPRYLEVVLAGLLHDVGKLLQRACAPGEGIGHQAAGLADFICPVGPHGRHTHQHVVYTAQFIIDHLNTIPRDLDGERVLRLATYHHRPSDADEALITGADRLSSGMEREDAGSEVDGRKVFRKTRLRAVTNEVAIDGRERAEGEWVIPLAPLSPAAGFPVLEDAPPPDRTAEYAGLRQGLEEEWQRNRVCGAWAFINRAMTVLERHAWCVPAATNAYPDISLFDHLKTTAAIAGCLALTPREEAQPFLLLAGDLGGIQSYLFGIRMGAGGLARRLRARSLFISLVTENVARHILRSVGLPLTNCIMSAGGRFTLLLPNTATTKAVLQQVESDLSEWARREVGCELHPHLAELPIGHEGMRRFGDALTDLLERLERKKMQPLQAILADGGGWREEAFLLDPVTLAEGEGLCHACYRRVGEMQAVRERQVPVCEQCVRDDEVGRLLVRARFIAFRPQPGRLPFGSEVLLEKESEIPSDAEVVVDLEGGSGELPTSPIVGRYVARFVPRDTDGSVLEFSELAELSHGRKALGYLKADVDNLGLVFRSGLLRGDEDRRSISRLATLSRSLEQFFSGYIHAKASQVKSIYTVYSGGDDLLLVGPWDALVGFAVGLRDAFRQFTCGNPSWTLSAGLAVVSDHTPVLLAAEEADACLAGAKRIRGDDITPWPGPAPTEGSTPTKDRLVAFGTALPWTRAAEVLTRAQQVLNWLLHGDLATARVRRLLRYAWMYQHWQRTGDVMGFQYAPLLVYDLKRNWGNAPEEAREWARSLTLVDSTEMPALRFISEYALQAARGEREGD